MSKQQQKSPKKNSRHNSRSPDNRPRSSQKSTGAKSTGVKPGNDLWLFGRHAVLAALDNPLRTVKRLLLTPRCLAQFQAEAHPLVQQGFALLPDIVAPDVLASFLPPDCVHQGIALLTRPLPAVSLADCCNITGDAPHLLLLLDQITDPHNVGAIMRSAAAFGARAIISPDRHSPPESGTLAKSASGALELIPWVRVTNLSRCLDQLALLGYWRLGLDGTADISIRSADFGPHIALVLGAEGRGLRPGTAAHCDALVRLPMSGTGRGHVESLNVSNAAAIALYEFSN